MAKITYVEWGGAVHEADVPSGTSVMEGAIDNNIPGIEAECGGSCSCATCHVYVDPEWFAVTGPAAPLEQDMLESVMDLRETSRLSCQIEVDDSLDGLVVRMPELQI